MGIRAMPPGPSSGSAGPVRVILTPQQVAATEPWARGLAIGGDSFRPRADRAAHLLADQRVGQRGEAALAVWFSGERRDLGAYVAARQAAQLRRGGDGGHDLPGLPVDIKTRRRIRGWDLDRHDLLVRPREKRQDWRYVLAVIPFLADEGEPQEVWLMGWAPSERLGLKADGPLAGNWVLPAAELDPLTEWTRRTWESELRRCKAAPGRTA